MIIGSTKTRILGLLMLIVAGGCGSGSGSGRLTAPPTADHTAVSSATGQLRLLVYIPDRSKQHGRRSPLASMSQPFLIRRASVSACLAETIQ